MTVTSLESVTLHRLALAPFCADAHAGIILESLRQALTIGEDRFLAAIPALYYLVLRGFLWKLGVGSLYL